MKMNRVWRVHVSYWGFRHYGNDISTSVAENYSNEWQSYTSKSYSSNQSKKKELLDSFALLATDRNDCYEFHCSCHGDGVVGEEITIIGSPWHFGKFCVKRNPNR